MVWLDSNPLPQNCMRRRYHGAMAAALFSGTYLKFPFRFWTKKPKYKRKDKVGKRKIGWKRIRNRQKEKKLKVWQSVKQRRWRFIYKLRKSDDSEKIILRIFIFYICDILKWKFLCLIWFSWRYFFAEKLLHWNITNNL